LNCRIKRIEKTNSRLNVFVLQVTRVLRYVVFRSAA
jgi:hypothetical protein